MNVIFLANYSKTKFFYAIAEQLHKSGITTYWASPSQKWSTWLTSQGVSSDHLFNATEYGEEWVDKYKTISDFKTLEWIEQQGNVSVRDTILQDRALSRKSFHRSKAYLQVVANRFMSFISKKDIDIVVGEQTWAFERIVAQICKSNGAIIVRPRSVRIPSERFGFFSGTNDAHLVRSRETNEEDFKEAQSFLQSFSKEKPKPRRFKQKQKLPGPKLEWFAKPFRAGEDPYDETRFQWRDIYNYSPRDINRTLRMVRTMVQRPFELNEVPSTSFVFITLHRQPEASVDVLGSYFSNQYETIKAIARSVPTSHRILVKEHSHGIGDRGPSFYSKIRSIPGTDLVDPYADTFSFLEEADLIVSISGTVCYEAGLLGKRAVTIAPMFFGPLLVQNGWNPFDSSVRQVTKWLNTQVNVPSYNERVKFMATLIANTFIGNINAPLNDVSCMDTRNISNVANAFLNVIDNVTSN